MMPTGCPPKRLFFALWPTNEIRGVLAAATRPLVIAGRGVIPENLHMTLAFIGMANADYQQCLEQAASELDVPSGFTLRVSRVGVFPKPRILWVGLEEAPEQLLVLQSALVSALVSCGYQPEDRPFRPHITIARKFRGEPPGHDFAAVEWSVRSFSLIESISTESGVVYRELRRWPLELTT